MFSTYKTNNQKNVSEINKWNYLILLDGKTRIERRPHDIYYCEWNDEMRKGVNVIV